MHGDETHDREPQLTTLLKARADALQVHPDLTSVLSADAVVVNPDSRSPRPWLVTAAALLALGFIAISQSADGEPTDVETAPGAGGAALEFAAPATTQEAIVWLDVGVTKEQVQSVAVRLGASPTVDAYRYIGVEATYEEFVAYFADKPEVIDLVEPEQLPTSFRVMSSTPWAVAELLDDVDGVDEVEVPEQAGG